MYFGLKFNCQSNFWQSLGFQIISKLWTEGLINFTWTKINVYSTKSVLNEETQTKANVE